MPTRPQRQCAHPGCARSAKGARCDTHRRERLQARRREHDDKRGSASSRGYGHRWRKARAAFLADNPLCALCGSAGRVTAAQVVDHRVPHRGDYGLFWDVLNWQALCTPCHSAKTARGE